MKTKLLIILVVSTIGVIIASAVGTTQYQSAYNQNCNSDGGKVVGFLKCIYINEDFDVPKTASDCRKIFGKGTTEMYDCIEKIEKVVPEAKAALEKLLLQNQIDHLPAKLIVTSGPTIRGDPGCGAVVDTNSITHWFGIDSISEPKKITLFSENPNQCEVNTWSCFCNAQMELSALTLDELNYFTLDEQEKYSDILIDYLAEENINRTPKFHIGKLNINYTDSSAIGYCGEIWGKNTYGFFDGAIVNDVVMDYGISKELPLLCAISDNAKWWE